MTFLLKIRTMKHGARPKKDMYKSTFLEECNNHYQRMIENCESLAYNDMNKELLQKLGDLMGMNSSNEPRKVSNIPAGYTYLGQFIDHDITFDPFSSTDSVQDPLKTINMRSPRLDLDSMYAGGPEVTPYLYDHSQNLNSRIRGLKFLLGSNQNNGPGGPRNPDGTLKIPEDFDIPRTSDGTGIIGDPRNDENLFVSQIHHSMLKFHNAVIDMLDANNVEREGLFEKARDIVTYHYQWIVVHDFLRRLVPDKILNDVFVRKNIKLFKSPTVNDRFVLPIEFTIGAYRFGHSMVRDNYGFNENFNESTSQSTFLNAFNFVAQGNLPVRSNWVVDLNRFFPTGLQHANTSNFELNLAMKIDTNMALSLEMLPKGINERPRTHRFMSILASLNLVRGLAFQLPSGQCLSKCCHVTPMQGSDLYGVRLRKEIACCLPKDCSPNYLQIDQVDVERPNELLDEKLLELINSEEIISKTPLWYYVLREAELKGRGNQLGPCGSQIIVETFYQMLKEDKESILNNRFKPFLPRIDGKKKGDFDMPDLLNFAGVL